MDIPSKYEMASLLANRALQLSNNSPTLLPLPLPKNLVDPLEIARKEIQLGLIHTNKPPFHHGKN
jgi:DNA-directed RNA polymerase subunit K/omega